MQYSVGVLILQRNRTHLNILGITLLWRSGDACVPHIAVSKMVENHYKLYLRDAYSSSFYIYIYPNSRTGF